MVHPNSVIEDTKIFTVGYIGICANCNHLHDCSFRQKSNKPVWYCDKYDAFTKTEGQAKNRDSPISSPTETESQSYEFKGLCINCEKRFGCIYAKTKGGIWHCNEYT